VTKKIRETSFQCEPLKELQKNAAKLNPLMLAMVAGVLDGVHGLSFALQEFKVNRTTAEQKNNRAFELSSLLTLSAENPLKVWQMLSAFAPQIAMITPTEKIQKLNLPEVNQLGLDVSVVIKGQHLILFTTDAENKTRQAHYQTACYRKNTSKWLFPRVIKLHAFKSSSERLTLFA